MKVPDEVQLKATLLNKGRPSFSEPGRLDDGQPRRVAEEHATPAGGVRDGGGADAGVREPGRRVEAPAHVSVPADARDREAVRREKVVVDSPEKRVDVFLSPYWGFAIERLVEAIHPDVLEGEAPEVPRYDERPRDRLDRRRRLLDEQAGQGSREVASQLRGLRLEMGTVGRIPPRHSPARRGVRRRTRGSASRFRTSTRAAPTSTSRTSSSGSTTAYMLILETKGYDDLEEVKAQAAERWVRP